MISVYLNSFNFSLYFIFFFFFSSRRRHTRSVSAFLLNRSSDLQVSEIMRQILTSRLSLSKHLAHNLGNLLLLGKIGVFHNRRNASSRLLLRSEERRVGKECRCRWSTRTLQSKESGRPSS